MRTRNQNCGYLDDFFVRFRIELERGDGLFDIPQNHVEMLIVRLAAGGRIITNRGVNTLNHDSVRSVCLAAHGRRAT